MAAVYQSPFWGSRPPPINTTRIGGFLNTSAAVRPATAKLFRLTTFARSSIPAALPACPPRTGEEVHAESAKPGRGVREFELWLRVSGESFRWGKEKKMSFGLGKRRLVGLGVGLAAVLFTANQATATDPSRNSGATTDQAGAVLVFPKVVFSQEIVNGTGVGSVRDTVIRIANTFNTPIDVHCYYIDARLSNPNQPPGPFNPRIWQETDFRLQLTKQQPTHWVVSTGRGVDPSDGLGEQNSGIDAGLIPPVTPGFEGELRCVTTDANGYPIGAPWLKGEATIRDEASDVSDYNAIALRPGTLAGTDDDGNSPSTILPLDIIGKGDGHFSSCPDALLLNVVAEGGNDPIVAEYGDCGSGCPTSTSVTLVPCSEDIENLVPGNVTVNIDVWDEFESALSFEGLNVQCWFDSALSELNTNVFDASFRASPTLLARFASAPGSGGLLGVAETTITDSGDNRGRAAYNLPLEGSRADVCDTCNPPELGSPVIDHMVLSAP